MHSTQVRTEPTGWPGTDLGVSSPQHFEGAKSSALLPFHACEMRAQGRLHFDWKAFLWEQRTPSLGSPPCPLPHCRQILFGVYGDSPCTALRAPCPWSKQCPGVG